MNFERSLFVTFLGNYLTNTVVAAVVALIPPSPTPGIFTAQYITYVILAGVTVALLTKWYFGSRAGSLRSGAMFGVFGFVVALVVAFISGLAGVLTQTGSLSQMIAVIPNFGPFLMSVSTVVLALYWVVPAALVGWWSGRKSAPAAM